MGEVAAVVAAFGRCERRIPAIFEGCDGRCSANLNTKLTGWKAGAALLVKIKTARTRTEHNGMSMIATATFDDSSKKPRSDIVTFSSNISTDIPLYEPPGVSFDDYLSDRPRIFRAMFPDQSRSKRLNDEEWRIQMLPIQFLLATVSPAVVMRLTCKSDGQGYPPTAPLNAPRILELQATRWELQGLDDIHMPTHFGLSVQGVLYSDRRVGGGRRLSRLKGHLEMSISLVLPPVIALVPEDIIRGVAESVLKRLVERMKQEVDGGLLSDFRSFGREKLMRHGPATPPSASAAAADQRGDDNH